MKFDISKQSKEYFQEIIYMHVFLHAIAKNPKKIIYVDALALFGSVDIK